MTHTPPSRNTEPGNSQPASQPPATLLDVKAKLKGMRLKPHYKADLVSGLHVLGKAQLREDDHLIDQALARIPVDARMLTPLLDWKLGARLGYKRDAWYNIGWRVRKALRLTGAWELFENRKITTNPVWEETISMLPARARWDIKLLAKWGSLHGIAPAALEPSHLPQFYQWLLTWKTQGYARKCYLRALGAWNLAAVGRPLPIETFRSSHYSVQMEHWSPELIAGVDRIMAKFREPDLDFDEEFEPVKEKTAKAYRERLFRTLSAYVVGTGTDPSTIKDVSVLMQPAAAKAALDFMLQWIRRRKPEVQKTSDIYESAKLIAVIAERCYRNTLPGDIILVLKRMSHKRSPVRKGMTTKNRELLRLFDDECFFARFLDLPRAVFERILKRPDVRRVDAIKLMLAFAVAQATTAPLRPANQAALVIDRHIFKVRNGNAHALAIRVPAEEVKNGVDLDFEVSGEVVQLYDVFLKYRLLLCNPDNPFLYPGPGSGPKFPGSLSPQLARFVEDELGVRLTGQQFRHIVGYVYLKSHPGDYEVIRELLGHQDVTTTMMFYAAMEKRAASKKVSDFLAQRKKELISLLRSLNRPPSTDSGND